MMLLFTVFQDWVLAPFIRPGDAAQQETIQLSRYMLYFIAGYLLVDSISICVSNALRGAGDTRYNMFVMTGVGIFLFAVPCVIVYKLGCPWWSLWIALESEILLLCILFVLRYFSGKWTKMRVIEVSAVKD